MDIETIGGRMKFNGEVEGVEVTLKISDQYIEVNVDGEKIGRSFRTAVEVSAHLDGLAIGLKRRKPDTAGATRRPRLSNS